MEIIKRFIGAAGPYRYEPFIEGDAVGFRVIDPSGGTVVVSLTPPSTWEEQQARPSDEPLGPTGAVWVVRDGVHLTAVETVSDVCDDPPFG